MSKITQEIRVTQITETIRIEYNVDAGWVAVIPTDEPPALPGVTIGYDHIQAVILGLTIAYQKMNESRESAIRKSEGE